MITTYCWQSFSKTSRKQVWLTDVNAFASLEDALAVGLETYASCPLYSDYRICEFNFDENSFDLVRKTPVFYVLKENRCPDQTAPTVTP